VLCIFAFESKPLWRDPAKLNCPLLNPQSSTASAFCTGGFYVLIASVSVAGLGPHPGLGPPLAALLLVGVGASWLLFGLMPDERSVRFDLMYHRTYIILMLAADTSLLYVDTGYNVYKFFYNT
jgi:hypothetical protein